MADLSFKEKLLVGNIHKAVRDLETLISEARDLRLDVSIEILENHVIDVTQIPNRTFVYRIQAEVKQ
jgi:hypothetical protein